MNTNVNGTHIIITFSFHSKENFIDKDNSKPTIWFENVELTLQTSPAGILASRENKSSKNEQFWVVTYRELGYVKEYVQGLTLDRIFVPKQDVSSRFISFVGV